MKSNSLCSLSLLIDFVTVTKKDHRVKFRMPRFYIVTVSLADYVSVLNHFLLLFAGNPILYFKCGSRNVYF